MGTAESRFVAGVPENYDRFLGPVIFEPYAADLAERLSLSRPADVLEIACGTGILTRRLRDALSHGARLTASDLNPEMVRVGKQRLGETVRWQAVDATALPFADASFDAVVCQFGIMFFPDKPAAMREARRVLRPGGRYALNVWGDFGVNPFGRIADETIDSYFPADPPGFYRTPMGFSDEATIRAMLGEAGFASVQVERVRKETVSPTAREFAIGLVRGNPVLAMIAERGPVDPEQVVEALDMALRREGGDRPFRSTMEALVVTAA